MIAVKFMLSHATVTNFRKSFFLPLHPCNNMAISNINIWLKSLSLIFFSTYSQNNVNTLYLIVCLNNFK